MIYLLLDDFHGAEELGRLKADVGDRTLQDLNVTTLDGQRTNIEDLKRACDAVPFLAAKRLVIVRRLLARLEPKSTTAARSSRRANKNETAQAIADHLPHIPPTTDLVFVETVLPSAGNVVLKAIRTVGGTVMESKPLKADKLVSWIEDRAKQKGGQMSHAAANELAIYVGSNLWLVDKEIDKLITYADGAPISERDIRSMVSYVREANIFGLLDSIGQRDGRAALRRLRELLADGEAPAYLLLMITRQIRLMLLAKEMVGQSKSPDQIGGELHLHPYSRDKLLQQIRRFTMAQLEQAYEKLLTSDTEIKTGRVGPFAALDLVVIELATVIPFPASTSAPRTL